MSTNLLKSPLLSLVLCNLNPSPPEMTLKEWAMLFHTPHLYACCSYWNARANSLACLCVCKCGLGGFSHVLLFVTLSIRLLCPWDFPAKNTGVGCHFFLWRIFWTQEQNPGLLHCRQIPALQADSLLTEQEGRPHSLLTSRQLFLDVLGMLSF